MIPGEPRDEARSFVAYAEERGWLYTEEYIVRNDTDEGYWYQQISCDINGAPYSVAIPSVMLGNRGLWPLLEALIERRTFAG